MRCVVTGATGHIGNVLVRELVKRKHDVTAFVLRDERTNFLEELPIQIVYGNVLDLDSLKSAFQEAEVVFHLAGIIEIGSFQKKAIWQVNVEGTKNVMEACEDTGVKKLIYTSSVHAIPEKPWGEIIEETTIFSSKLVKGAYAKTKAEATRFLLEHETSVETIIVHPSGVIGPYEYVLSNLGQLILDCSQNKMKVYINGGYNFVDVRDVVNGIIAASEYGKDKECYILGGEYLSVKKLIQLVCDISGAKMPSFRIARSFAYMTGFLAEIYYKVKKQKPLFTSYSVYTLGTNSIFSIEKAKRELGYSPRYIAETIKDTIQWFKERKVL